MATFKPNDGITSGSIIWTGTNMTYPITYTSGFPSVGDLANLERQIITLTERVKTLEETIKHVTGAMHNLKTILDRDDDD